MELKKYKIKELSENCTVLHFKDLESTIQQNGFLVFVLKTLNPDEAAELVDLLGEMSLPIPFFVSTVDMNVYEVVKKIEESEERSNVEEEPIT